MAREAKKEIANHLIVSILIFVLVELFWLASANFSVLTAVIFISGLGIGTFLIDSDHLVYWYFLKPEIPESAEARDLIGNKKYQQALTLLSENHKNHTGLVFHHFIFQFVLLAVSFFVISSTTSIFGQAIVLAMSAHLLLDQYLDLIKDPDHLKSWLFSRTPFSLLPIPHSWLKGYFAFYCFSFLLLIFFFIR